MTDLIVSDELCTFLLAEGVVQDPPAEGGPAAALPIILDAPRQGAPEPRAGREPATVSLRTTSSGPLLPHGSWMVHTFIDVIVRAPDEHTAIVIQRQVLELLHPNDAIDGRKMWDMAALLVERSACWRPDQSLAVDDTTYTRVQSFLFECRRKALQGLPYVP